MAKTILMWTGGILITLWILIFLIGAFSPVGVFTTSSEQKGTNLIGYYYLPESVLKIKVKIIANVAFNSDHIVIADRSEIIEQTFESSEETVADPGRIYYLYYNPNLLMTDELKYAVNEKGLLTTLDVTSDDRSDIALSKIGKVLSSSVINAKKTKPNKNEHVEFRVKEYTAEFAVRISSFPSNEKRIFEWPEITDNELKEFLPLREKLSFTVILPDAKKQKNIVHEYVDTIDGLLTKPKKTVRVVIENVRTNLHKEQLVGIVSPNSSEVMNIPVNRTRFVKRINKIVLKDGIIMSNEINNPSSFDGFVSIPVNVVKAFISIQ